MTPATNNNKRTVRETFLRKENLDQNIYSALCYEWWWRKKGRPHVDTSNIVRCSTCLKKTGTRRHSLSERYMFSLCAFRRGKITWAIILLLLPISTISLLFIFYLSFVFFKHWAIKTNICYLQVQVQRFSPWDFVSKFWIQKAIRFSLCFMLHRNAPCVEFTLKTYWNFYVQTLTRGRQIHGKQMITLTCGLEFKILLPMKQRNIFEKKRDYF